MNRFGASLQRFGRAVVCAAAVFSSLPAEQVAAQSKAARSTVKWQVLHLASKAPRRGIHPLDDTSTVQNLTELNLVGPSPGHQFLLGNYAINGRFGIQDGALTRTEGLNAAIQLAEVEDFELEGLVNAEGLGGWFWLLGFAEGHGYMVYNTTLKVSGSPWQFCEFRGHKAIEETHREINRLAWKGVQPLMLSIKDKKLSLTVGTARLADGIELENHHKGQLILGTYETRYGASPVRIQSLRIREIKSDK
jgi:hypothetical protein